MLMDHFFYIIRKHINLCRKSIELNSVIKKQIFINLGVICCYFLENKYSDKVYKVNSHMLIRKCHYITAKEAICLSVALLVPF